MILDYFRLAFNNLRHRKKRSWLTIIGTLIGIMAVVSLISIGQGLENSIAGELNELGGNKIFISPGGGVAGRFSGTTFKLTDDDINAIRNTRGVEETVGLVSGSRQVEYDDESQFVSISGLPVAGTEGDLARRFTSVEIIEGRYLRPNDRSSAIISESTAEDRFEDEVELRSKLDLNGTEFSVVGIYSTSATVQTVGGMTIPIERARELFDKEDEYDFIIAETGAGYSASSVAEDVERNLREERDAEKGSEGFQVRTAEDIIRSFQNQLAIVRAILVGIGAISLLVGGVGIMNTMYTSVTERTREIGIMKALGATNRQILSLFLIESGVIGMVGGLLGATVGLGLSYIASVLITQQLGAEISPYVSAELILGSILFSFVVGMISGVLPARKAANMKPVEALRFK
jgi:putative ABC transport system permease protein